MSAQHVKVIRLSGGGLVRLVGDFDVFALTEEERDFVCELALTFEGFEQVQKPTPPQGTEP